MWQQLAVSRQAAIEQQARAERAERLLQNSQQNYSQLVAAIERERDQEKGNDDHRKHYEVEFSEDSLTVLYLAVLEER